NLRNKNQCPRGMYVIPATDNIHVWYGVLFLHDGDYENAVFKFRLTIPESYPAQGPTLTFISDVFHPLVDPSGILSLRARFPIWRSKRDTLHHVLLYVKDIFRHATVAKLRQRDCPNHDALSMYQSQPSVYKELAQKSVQDSMKDSILFDNYPEENPIKLGRISESKHGRFLRSMHWCHL
ncbi:ubiquitin-conjugating enzyme/RWD-like protein, partial [Piptocephalis cylindrospora]